MTRRLAPLRLLLAGCTPAAFAAALGLASAAGPVAASAIDYAAQAQRLAPNAAPADLAEIERRLAKLEQCDGAARAVIAADAGTGDTAALIDAAAALRGLTDAIEHARAVTGKDGGL